MRVRKRNGKFQEFNFGKITKAITNAFKSSPDWPHNGDVPMSLLNGIAETLSKKEQWTVEDIQDIVEFSLMEQGFYKEAKAYIIYREKHREMRFLKDRIDYMEEYSKSNDNAASSSETDPNANVLIKNVANLGGEVYKVYNRKVQRSRMKTQLQNDYPEVADQYEKDLGNHVIYAHDESSTPAPDYYCKAVQMYPFLEHGTSTLDGLGTTAPKNLNSFCGQFINLTFLLSSQCKGAVGFAEFFNFFDWACVQEWGESYHLKDQAVITTDYCLKRATISSRIEQCFQNVVYSICQPAGNRLYQCPFINFNYFDKYYWRSLFGEYTFPDGSKPSWERVSYLQKKFMRWFNNERAKTLLTFPVESLCLLNDGKDYLDKEYKEFAAEMWADGHSFFVYTSDNAESVASCCRLRNDVKLFNSSTGLTGIEIGSCNVITLNLNRIVQDFFKENTLLNNSPDAFYNNFKPYLEKILERVYKYQVAYKNILYKWEKRGMFSSVNAGYIHMNKLYSTYGINGLNEAAEFLGLEVSNNEDYKGFCVFVLGVISDFIKGHNSKKYMLNLELVPAESLGAKNYQWDKADGYWVPSDRNLYNSYIYDAHKDTTTIFDKLELQGGDIAKALSGGQAAHLNLEDHLTKEQYLKVMEYAVKVGCNYFTFNIPNTQCDDCKKIYKKPLTICPNCGSHNMTQWTRVIGYLRPTKAFSADRKIEAAQRIYAHA